MCFTPLPNLWCRVQIPGKGHIINVTRKYYRIKVPENWKGSSSSVHVSSPHNLSTLHPFLCSCDLLYSSNEIRPFGRYDWNNTKLCFLTLLDLLVTAAFDRKPSVKYPSISLKAFFKRRSLSRHEEM